MGEEAGWGGRSSTPHPLPTSVLFLHQTLFGNEVLRLKQNKSVAFVCTIVVSMLVTDHKNTCVLEFSTGAKFHESVQLIYSLREDRD